VDDFHLGRHNNSFGFGLCHLFALGYTWTAVRRTGECVQFERHQQRSGNCGVSCGAGDSLVQPGYAGTFSSLTTGAVLPRIKPAIRNLRGDSQSGHNRGPVRSHIGSSGKSFNASATAGNLLKLVLTSDYLNFVGQTEETRHEVALRSF